ncbi:CDC48 family AAA ATPase [Vulcanisaeta distributa]|uniref:AAA family ATPase, CDC48 subfamily n=1 Tax=Vulcanisaeta distributa (strain DSM 14429 / JCM 11212 / NBRC 100878 / IC-017) TaxID=572478 RepID=E1QP14_VULDI|nr:CDC48 family AAA ATPase [Vulcanisaeta distributa]ADN51379.1 AAA family ATPase, CDC48 subfamily [Vulcanisaeta distributa DSM 14429]
MGSNNEVSLRVAEARTRDVGRLIVRIPQRYMRVLGIEPGEYVEIVGNKRSAYAQVWPAYTDDEDKDYIRMDGVLRQNAGVSIGDVVKVRKANLRSAQRVTIAPVGEYIRVDPDYLKRAYLLGKPVWKGSIIEIPYYTGSIRFMVTSVTPGPAAYVGIDTEVQVREEPVREMELTMPRVTWEDIGDLEEAKRKIRELIELPLRHPEIFKHLGIEPPKGVLLIGPPGTGKTLLAKAVASEANAYFISINGPEIMSKYYGESEAKLREIFEEAKKNAPAIIFIDEIDAIAPKREEVTGEVEKRVVAQLLTLMDGLQERGQVIVIGATNRPEAVDPALRRPGRFDREIYISMPDKNARKEILQVHTRNVPLCTEDDVKEKICDPSDVVNIDEIAEMTHGYTGADLAALVKEAAMIRLREAIDVTKEIDLDQPQIPPEQLARIRIRMRDFLEAMKYIQPTVLREVIVEVPEVHWDDIGGYENVKQELKEMVEWPLKYPRYFEELGVEPPKGILLFGPPGTGKTLLAKAVATESNANFIAVRGPEILSKWFGESERAIREIFKKARMAAPCVIFFDEIDAIAPARGLRVDSGATDRIVNQLLAEMDGIAPLKNVVVIAATNRADIIDPALLRPGRFDRIVYVPPPDANARFEILKVHIRGLKLADDVKDGNYKYLRDLARRTEGYTGADLAALVREAAMLALRETIRSNTNQVKPVGIEHFEEALKVVPPSLSKQDIARFEEMARNLRRTLRGL